MSEIRRDRTTGAWVIVAPERGHRPRQPAAPAPSPAPGFDPACPFCPGNEGELPGIIAEAPSPAAPGWRVRVVPNKHPALRPLPPDEAAPADAARPGHGFHEVVIESPRHDAALADLSDGEIAAVLGVYHDRFVALAGQPRIRAVVLFRNHGAAAGASLAHPHAQLLALPLLPPRAQSQIDWAARRSRERGHCPVCDELARERDDARRIVEERRHFAALVPFAATCPFETWLVPKRHQASFAEIDDDELAELGPFLRGALRRLRRVLGEVPYNFFVDPLGPAETGQPHLHWRLRILPGLVRPGGFELATGLAINPSRPEEDAEALRGADGGS
ncbi:MAG: hypothetical protein M5U07_19645 [Xanthobacteraceae bacterium]|nr:hypothetical protein [Xanthobacteraceae bacterium]